jgi:CRISPR-associated protein Csx10
MTKELTFGLHFLSDWQVSDGAGARGHVDSVIRRHPQDRLPFVPAKTLTGILRDGCERVAWGLDSGDQGGPWHGLLRCIFGGDRSSEDPRSQPARLSLGPARLAPALRAALKRNPAVKEALVFLKPGVKLKDGVADSQMLRFEEVALAGAELSGTLELNLDDPWRAPAIALLAAGALAVERLGAKRRRGSGRCRLSLDGAPEGAALADALANPLPEGDPPGPPQPTDLTLVAPERHVEGGWHVLNLDLRLQTPVLVPNKTLGNLVSTKDHIPGSLLIPALDAWFKDLLGDRRTLALAGGAVQVRNAYPCWDDQRLLPVPAALFKRKEGEDFTNHLLGEPPAENGERPQRKQQRGGYVSPLGLPPPQSAQETDKNEGSIHKVDTLAITHATVDDETQRPTEAVGGVFTYQAIRPGQPFRAELWIARSLVKELPERWCEAAPKSIRIGRAKKDDYGRVSLACTKAMTPPVEPADGCLKVWLVSPLLLRDDALNFSADPELFAERLGESLGVTLTHKPRDLGNDAPQQSESSGAQSLAAFTRTFRDEGWINAWQMRRPSRFGLAAGSCFAFEVVGTLDAATLTRVQSQGLGERRGEGYGELVFNPGILAKTEPPLCQPLGNGEEGNPRGAASAAPPVSTDFTQALERRAARLIVRRHASEREQAFRREMGWTGTNPPNTQLGALRALMEPLKDGTGLQRMANWLRALEDNPKRRDKWPETTRRELALQIGENGIRAVWERLGLPEGPPALTLERRTALRAELRAEAIRALWLAAISRQLNESNRSRPEAPTEEYAHGA